MTPIEAACLLITILSLAAGAIAMATSTEVKQRVADLNAKLDAAIGNRGTVPPVVATQADLDEIAAGVEAANAKADILTQQPQPAPAQPPLTLAGTEATPQPAPATTQDAAAAQAAQEASHSGNGA